MSSHDAECDCELCRTTRLVNHVQIIGILQAIADTTGEKILRDGSRLEPRKGEESVGITAKAQAINADFYHHMDTCGWCGSHPFALCDVGDQLLTTLAAAAILGPK